MYFYWNDKKLKNSGQIHIKSEHKIGFFDGEIVNIFVDGTRVLIVSTGIMRDPKQKAKPHDIWRSLTQEYVDKQDFDFKHRPLFKLLNFQFTTTFKAIKVRACDYIEGVDHDKFAILVNTK